MKKLSAFTAALFATAGLAFQQNLIPNKYAGYAMLAGVFVQAFQQSVIKPDAAAAAQIAVDAGATPGMVHAATVASGKTV